MGRSRLAKLSHAQLLEIAVDACESSPELKNKADALIAKVAPLPSWCVDILLSPDLLPQLFSSLGLSEHTAAGVCSTWSRAYSRQLRRSCYIDPRRVRLLADVPQRPNGLCMLPGGVLAIASYGAHSQAVVNFVAARNDSDLQALAAYRASTLATRRFKWPMGLALTNDGLLVCCLRDPSAALYKFDTDGSMDELATVPALADYGEGFTRCAVHQQTQRTYALVNDADEGRSALVLLDANLQIIATVLKVDTAGGHHDLAVHGDQVIVLTGNGSGLQLIDLDGRFLRTIAAGQFLNPQAVTASHGRAFVIDNGEGEDEDGVILGQVLYIIDIQSGDIIQRVHVDLQDEASAILVDGDEIFIAGFGRGMIAVLQLAGSEA